MRLVLRAMKEPKSYFSGAFFDILFLSRNRKRAIMTSKVKEAEAPLENVKSGLRRKRNVFVWRYFGALVVNIQRFFGNFPKTQQLLSHLPSAFARTSFCAVGRGAPTRDTLGAILGSSFCAFLSRAE